MDIIKGTTKSHHYDIIARGSARQKNAIKMTAMGRAMFKYSSDEVLTCTPNNKNTTQHSALLFKLLSAVVGHGLHAGKCLHNG